MKSSSLGWASIWIVALINYFNSSFMEFVGFGFGVHF